MVHVFLAAIVLVAFLGRKSRYSFSFAMLVLCVFTAVRYDYGADYRNYQRWYEDIQLSGFRLEDGDWLYNLLNYLSPSYYILVAFVGCVFVWAVYFFIRNHLSRPHRWIALFIFIVNPYLFLINLSALRQCMALVLFMIAVEYGIRRKFWVYAALIAVATMFHVTAILLLPIYFVLSTKPFRTSYVLLVFLGLFALLFVVDLERIAYLVASAFGEADYMYYITQESNTLRATLLSSLFFLYVLANLPRLSGKHLVYGKLYLLATVLSVLAFRLSVLTRVQMYFDIFSVVTLPQIFLQVQAEGRIRISGRNHLATIWAAVNKYVLPTLLLIIYFLRYYSFFTNPLWENYVEYQTLLSLL